VLDDKEHSILWFAMLQRIARFASHCTHALFQSIWSGRVVWIALIAFALSGCVKYDVGITFDSPTQGTIAQHVQLDERFTRVNSGAAQAWLANIEQRARQVRGKARRVSSKEVLVTIPFSTGQELEKRFNTFFDAKAKVKTSRKVELPPIESHLTVQQGNFLLLERRKLIYDVDLRSLGVASPQGEVLVDSSPLLDLQFELTTPWGAKNVVRPGSVASRRVGKQLVWMLQPGQKNHLEAAFWMPSPLGIGTVIIIAIVAIGTYIKNQQPPSAGEPSVEPSTANSL
jgi:hypothetical protein